MGEAPAWAERWRVVAPAGAVRVDIDLRARPSGGGLPRLAPGGALVLCASGPFARRRVRRAAARGGVALEREYLALPSGAEPAFLVQDGPAALDYFRRRILATPPGLARTAWLAEVALRAARALPTAVLTAVVPGRLAIGRPA
jgi:hypothetical protein